MGDGKRDEDRPAAGPAGARRALVGSYARRGLEATVEVPINLERVLLMAVEDAQFCGALLSDADRALGDRHIELQPSEKAALASMPRSVLEATVAGLKPNRQLGRAFTQQVAAAVAGTVLLSAGAYCCGGIDGEDEYSRDAGADGRVDRDGGEAGGDGSADLDATNDP